MEKFISRFYPESSMKRNAIQLAGKTLLVSLPKQWVDVQHIKKGQELEVTAAGNRLIVSAFAKQEKKQVVLSEKNAPWLNQGMLSYLYQLGIDEVKLQYDSGSLRKRFEQKVSQLLGFEIVHQQKNQLTIKNLAGPAEEEYASVLRRSFFVIQEIGSLLEKLAANPNTELREEILSMDFTLNKLTDFCKRILNKHEAHTAVYLTTQYSIVRDLEKISDEYRDAAKSLQKKSPVAVQKLIKDANAFFRLFHELYYDFSEEKATIFHSQKKKLLEQGERLLSGNSVVHHILNIITLTKDLFGPLYLLRMNSKKDAKDITQTSP